MDAGGGMTEIHVVDVRWFTSRDCIGIVKVYDRIENTVSYYIGVVSGNDASADAQHIADWGNSFPHAAAEILFR